MCIMLNSPTTYYLAMGGVCIGRPPYFCYQYQYITPLPIFPPKKNKIIYNSFDSTISPVQYLHMDGLPYLLSRIGWKQKHLAERIDVTPDTVSRWCTGKRETPRVVILYLQLLIQRMDVQCIYLLARWLEKTPASDRQSDTQGLDKKDEDIIHHQSIPVGLELIDKSEIKLKFLNKCRPQARGLFQRVLR